MNNRLAELEKMEQKRGWANLILAFGKRKAFLYLAVANKRIHDAGIHNKDERDKMLSLVLQAWA